MRLHALKGHENAALRQFEACRALLKKSLGAEPEAQTISLVPSLQSRVGSEYKRTAPGADVASQPQVFSAPAKHHDRPSLAVLPFQNLSGDAEQE